MDVNKLRHFRTLTRSAPSNPNPGEHQRFPILVDTIAGLVPAKATHAGGHPDNLTRLLASRWQTVAYAKFRLRPPAVEHTLPELLSIVRSVCRRTATHVGHRSRKGCSPTLLADQTT